MSRCPRSYRARAVVALRDLTGEVDVVERVVFDVDREVIFLGVRRDALGYSPRDEHAVLLEPEVPVQAAGGVLLHHEPRRLGGFAGHLGAGFWCLLEVSLGLVLGELLGHLKKRLGHGRLFLLNGHSAGPP